ncbi:MAG: hypothetical protein ABFR75_07110 [Acidobacteriota bacterium]
MSYSKYPLLKKGKNKQYSLEKYNTEFTIKDMVSPFIPGSGIKSLINSFPDKKHSIDIVELIRKMRFARNSDRPIGFYFNSGIISSGLSPLIIDLMERGWISSISSDMDFLVMDFETALAGKFVEYYKFNNEGMKIGGIAEETGLFLNIAFKEGFKEGAGIGESAAKYLSQSKFKFNESSILSKAYSLNIPVTIHSFPGSHPLQFHQSFDSKIYGIQCEKDYVLFASILSKLNNKGVFAGFNITDNLYKVFLNSLWLCSQNNIKVDDYFFAIINNGNKEINLNDFNFIKKENIFYFKSEPEIMLPLINSMLLSDQ